MNKNKWYIMPLYLLFFALYMGEFGMLLGSTISYFRGDSDYTVGILVTILVVFLFNTCFFFYVRHQVKNYYENH